MAIVLLPVARWPSGAHPSTPLLAARTSPWAKLLSNTRVDRITLFYCNRLGFLLEGGDGASAKMEQSSIISSAKWLKPLPRTSRSAGAIALDARRCAICAPTSPVALYHLPDLVDMCLAADQSVLRRKSGAFVFIYLSGLVNTVIKCDYLLLQRRLQWCVVAKRLRDTGRMSSRRVALWRPNPQMKAALPPSHHRNA